MPLVPQPPFPFIPARNEASRRSHAEEAASKPAASPGCGMLDTGCWPLVLVLIVVLVLESAPLLVPKACTSLASALGFVRERGNRLSRMLAAAAHSLNTYEPWERGKDRPLNARRAWRNRAHGGGLGLGEPGTVGHGGPVFPAPAGGDGARGWAGGARHARPNGSAARFAGCTAGGRLCPHRGEGTLTRPPAAGALSPRARAEKKSGEESPQSETLPPHLSPPPFSCVSCSFVAALVRAVSRARRAGLTPFGRASMLGPCRLVSRALEERPCSRSLAFCRSCSAH